MSYLIKEIFPTLQGEGRFTGQFAVFVRFGGCNLWTGRQSDRERDALSHGAECPLWCDTDFADGQLMQLHEVMEAIEEARCRYERGPRTVARKRGDKSRASDQGAGLIVFTGGEPLLQLDRAIMDALRDDYPDWLSAIETNGTVLPKRGVLPDWVCVSPKVPVEQLKITGGNELKIVVPAYDPLAYESIAHNFGYRYVSPEAVTSNVGRSLIDQDAMRNAAEFCLRNPQWRLSLQTHKVAGLP